MTNITAQRIIDLLYKKGGLVAGKFTKVGIDSYVFETTGEMIDAATYHAVMARFMNKPTTTLSAEEIQRNRVRAKAIGDYR